MLTKIGRFLLSLTLLLFAVAVHAQTPTASISCPATALVGEPVICDGSGSTGINGQVGWSVQQFSADATAPVAWDFGDNLGPYSKAELLRATHVYLTAGTYTISFTGKNSGGASASTSTSITISDIPAATGGNIQTLTNQGSNAANVTALQNAINTAFANNTVEQEIRLPAITYQGQFTIPAAAGNKYVTIRPTDISWLPGPLVRIGPSQSGNMPKLKAAPVSSSQGNPPLIINGSGRKYLRVLGIEFQKGTAAEFLYNFVEIGSDSPSTFSALPNHIIFDRDYFHGNATEDLNRGLYVQSDYISILNSYFKDIHVVGADAQCVATFAGTGFGFVNNFCEAYGENIMWGGADTSVRYTSNISSPTTTSATFSSVTDLTPGTPLSLPLSAGTTAGTGFSTSSATGQVADGTPIQRSDLLETTSGTIIGTVQSVNTATSPDTITLETSSQYPGARINVSAGVAIIRRNAGMVTIARSVSGSNVTYDAVSATPTTAGPAKYGATPQDIFVARNYFPKDLYYRVGDPAYNGSYGPVVKNTIEFKHARRAVLVGNYLDYNWSGQGQSGPTILFTVRNQSNTNPWATVRDIQFSDSRIRHLPDAFNYLGTDVADIAGSSGYVQYIVVRNNLLEDLDGSKWGGGYGAVVVMTTSPRNLTLSHNTAISLGGNEFIIADNTLTDNMLYLNNINAYENYGFFGSGGSLGDAAIAGFTTNSYFHHNVFSDDVGGHAANGDTWTAPRGGPNYFPATIDTNTFVNRAGGDYHLSSSSPYKAGNATPAADGTDIGVNFDDVSTATANTIGGDWSGSPGSGFVIDTFTEASDTTLASHTGEVGATWTLHPSYSGAALDNGSLKRIYLNTSAAAAYYASGAPPSANYCVQADFNRVTQISDNISIVIGMDTASDAGLLLRGNDNGTTFQWEVIDRAGGSNTLLTSSSANQPSIGGAAITMKMCRNGTSVTVFANGVQDTALNATTTTTATGKAGIRASGQATSTTGIHLDNFSATAVVPPSDFVTDTFTEASDTTLASHTGEVGATWTLHPSYSGAALDNGSLKRIYLNTSAAAAYYASGAPPSANYCVQADFNRVTQISNNISIVIGMDTASDAGLLLRGNDNGTAFQWEVIDRAGGSNTLLTSSSANQPSIGGAAITMKMCRNGTAVTVFANGVQDTTLNATTTTTAVGKAGIRASGQATSTTGTHLDNFHAQ